jgi:hypothetical protein
MFNTCSQRPTHRSLIDTGRCDNLGGADFPQHSSRPSQPMILRFPPKGPTRSPLYNIPPTILKLRIKGPMVITWSSDHSTVYRDLHLRLAKAIDLSLAIGLIRMDQKVNLMQLGHHFNSNRDVRIPILVCCYQFQRSATCIHPCNLENNDPPEDPFLFMAFIE